MCSAATGFRVSALFGELKMTLLNVTSFVNYQLNNQQRNTKIFGNHIHFGY